MRSKVALGSGCMLADAGWDRCRQKPANEGNVHQAYSLRCTQPAEAFIHKQSVMSGPVTCASRHHDILKLRVITQLQTSGPKSGAGSGS